MKKNPIKVDTLLSHAGEDLNSQTGAIVPAIQTSTTFARDRNYQLNSPEFLYGRDDNVLFKNIEELICQLENGEESRVFASGMASISAVFRSVPPRSTIIMQRGFTGERHFGFENTVTTTTLN